MYDSIDALPELEDTIEMGCDRDQWDPGHNE